MSKERNRLKMERQEGQEKEEWKAVDRKNKKKKKEKQRRKPKEKKGDIKRHEEDSLQSKK